jgi:aminodeoxyfutalosine synthase
MALTNIEKSRVTAALEKGSAGERLRRDEGLALFSLFNREGIYQLGRAAEMNRNLRFENLATYVHNIQINPSNICEGTCGFCRYRAAEGDSHAYVLDEETIIKKIETLVPTEVHIVGGMNRIWPFERNLALIKEIRNRFPKIHIKAYTAVEIDYFSRKSALSRETVLLKLKAAGLNALPGGGAELFSQRMRKKYCPDKLSADGWLAIHKIAHRLGISTNSTMLYGLEEPKEALLDHMLRLRDAEDEAPGFSCFIPLPFQPGARENSLAGPSPIETLGVIAAARLILDNIRHIKAYWPMIGLETASAALSFGADDLDGTIGEERIAHAAGALTPKAMTQEKMEHTIRLGGYTPVERDGAFNTAVSKAGRK